MYLYKILAICLVTAPLHVRCENLYPGVPYAGAVRLEVQSNYDLPNISQEKIESLRKYYETFFKKEVSKWVGGTNPIHNTGLAIGIVFDNQKPTQGTAWSTGIDIVIGNDVPIDQSWKEAEQIVAHEVGHVVFQRLSGWAGANPKLPLDLRPIILEMEKNETAELGLNTLIGALDELYADTTSLYMTGHTAAHSKGGHLYDFSHHAKVSTELFRDSWYTILAPARATIYKRYHCCPVRSVA